VVAAAAATMTTTATVAATTTTVRRRRRGRQVRGQRPARRGKGREGGGRVISVKNRNKLRNFEVGGEGGAARQEGTCSGPQRQSGSWGTCSTPRRSPPPPASCPPAPPSAPGPCMRASPSPVSWKREGTRCLCFLRNLILATSHPLTPSHPLFTSCTFFNCACIVAPCRVPLAHTRGSPPPRPSRPLKLGGPGWQERLERQEGESAVLRAELVAASLDAARCAGEAERAAYVSPPAAPRGTPPRWSEPARAVQARRGLRGSVETDSDGSCGGLAPAVKYQQRG
jgi:hypothetical protein